MQHILVDYESIQPTSIKLLDSKDCHVWLFLGVQQQKNLPLALVESLLEFQSKNIHIIKMPYSGKNALDLYLAYHLGHILALDPKANIQVLARDGGYDKLIDHLNQSEVLSNVIRVAETVKQLTYNHEPKSKNKHSTAEKQEAPVDLAKDSKPIKSQQPDPSRPKDKDKSNKANKKAKRKDQDKAQKKRLKKQYKKSYKRAVALLEKQTANSRPKNKQSLTNFLQSKLPECQPDMIAKIIKKLAKKQLIRIEKGNSVHYSL
ncbi:PIN domain-containing protein [Psychrobacter sp. FDAARGOS_221]|uniref:PIN domain-containing protein n=1 Tax=Psychrobacter sp. FDAARGOS_221 TaxID=1975705 RepID=UPI000BB545B9|nr:PIN domain-containing protein [Psychrobacter sp. FDAARGOS_221]PNK61205.1 hypothetical protein A6J60_010200 [Psychrobacter sp. FDAARGOS_221]